MVPAKAGTALAGMTKRVFYIIFYVYLPAKNACPLGLAVRLSVLVTRQNDFFVGLAGGEHARVWAGL